MIRTKFNGTHPPSVTKPVDPSFWGDRFSLVRQRMIDAYADYIKSVEWKNVQVRVKNRDKYRCVDCKKPYQRGKRFVVHHESYAFFGQGNREEVRRCVLLCSGCHNKRHRNMDTPFFAKRQPDSHFTSDERSREVNGILMNNEIG